jgi:bla regulator protein BlaR1
LRAIYEAMSKDQRHKATKLWGLVPAPIRPAKKIPTEKQFELWKDGSIYGVWLDNKKISNSVLDKYKATDIIYFDISNLYGAAKRNVTYKYQLNMYTAAGYEKAFKGWKESE